MSYLLFFIYLIFFCWLLSRLQFFKNSGLETHILIFLFLIRVVAGLCNGYLNIYYYPRTDVNGFQLRGLVEYNLLFNNPKEYLLNIFQSNHNNSFSGFLDANASYWNDTRSNLIAKMLSIFDIFSMKNFFINTLFYNFLIFFGTVSLYKVFIQIIPTYKYVVIACIFLMPSVIYFSSAIHRDGLIYLSLCMVIYHIFFLIKTKSFFLKRIIIILLYLALILLLRNFVFITLAPALCVWIIATQKPKHTFKIFAGLYAIIICLFFATSFLSDGYNLPAHVSERQLEFIKIEKKSSSGININPLFPNIRSFFNNTPQALNHSLMRPYLTEHNNALYIPASLEIFLYEMVFICFIFFKKDEIIINPFFYFCIFFSITMFLVIGFTIPILGAIVRYRSIYFPFLLIPVICNINWTKLKSRFV